MGKRKIECNNKSCKHHVYDGKCDTCIVLDEAGKCQSFEKGFAYYFHIVWNALGNKNFIDAIEVKQKPDEDLPYYTLAVYNYGKQGAKANLWDQGVVKYTYNTKIMDRAQQLKEEKKKAEEGRR